MQFLWFGCGVGFSLLIIIGIPLDLWPDLVQCHYFLSSIHPFLSISTLHLGENNMHFKFLLNFKIPYQNNMYATLKNVYIHCSKLHNSFTIKG